MANARVHIDSFQSVDSPTLRTPYEEFRAKVLEAGRFSVFEATANRTAASMFTRLCGDPTVKTELLGYPWTGVKSTGRDDGRDDG